MSWVLVLITMSSAVTYVPFDTQANCEAAKAKMGAYVSVKIVECFRK